MKIVLVSTFLASAVLASPFERFGLDKRASSDAGSTTTDLFPPTGIVAGPSSLFPDESAIGYPGPTLTGVEPEAIQTAPAYPSNQNPDSPLIAFTSNNITTSSNGNFSIFKQWGNLSPWYTVPSSAYGLDNASPLIPDGCTITQMHLLYRHGARYPTSGSAPSAFAAKVHNATQSASGFNATGALSFLNSWTYKIGAELLTPFGRQQNFNLGVEYRNLYGGLLNNFTEAGTIPIFRTESQDRMYKTAINFMAGFFGIPEYTTEANLEIVVEAPGFNNTGAPYEICTNSNVPSRGQLGNTASAEYLSTALAPTAQRLGALVSGFNVTTTDVAAMLQLCAYETQALGYSAFCELFSEEEFEAFEYAFDLSFYYNNGAGSPVAAAQGKGYLEEFVARLEMSQITEFNSTTNSTLDSNPATFPLNQSIYADATHEVVVLDTLTAFNLTALFSSGPLPINSTRPTSQSFVASQVVPFATHFTIQVLSCASMNPTKQIRFIVNDAVLPIDQSYPGCPVNADGLCSFDTVLTALHNRIDEIDFDYDCFGNYTATLGNDYNGRAPRNSTM